MEVTFTFTLPEESAEYAAFSMAPNILRSLEDLDRTLRSITKYDTVPAQIDFVEHNDEYYINVDNLRSYIFELLQDNNVHLD